MRSLLLICCLVVVGSATYLPGPLVATSFGLQTTLTFSGINTSETYSLLTAEVMFNSSTSLRVRISPVPGPGQSDPYVIPEVVLPGSNSPASQTVAAANPRYSVTIDATTNVIQVRDKLQSDGLVVEFASLVVEERYVSFTTAFDSPATARIYGYGEHDYYYFINKVDNVTLSLWNTDNGTPWKNPMYGVHPVMFFSDPTTARHFGFMWGNSHAQSAHIENGQITFIALGGTIDLYIFVDDTPLGVIKQYHKVIGKAHVPPYWSLGTHQCRWGYRNLTMLEGIVAGYASHGIPLETIWTDIDYMDEFRIFTTDPIRYPEAPFRAFIDQLHANDQHIVQIVDPGVAQQNYSVFMSGLENDAYVKMFGQPLINVVWPGWTAFPDFTSDSASQWWGQQISLYLDKIPLDGIWLDMNELGTFCAGYCNVSLGTPFDVDWKTLDWSTFTEKICMPNNCSVVPSAENYPLVNPLHNGYDLFNKTLDMDASLALGSYYQTKTFYGQLEERATHEALLARSGTRPFVLSRASFVGSGKYTAHWTGDNNALWNREDGGIQDSIQAILGSNLWNIPVVGADIGGFGGPATTEELIVRWYQLGAFYTFMRNHRDLQGPAQEPFLFSAAAQGAMKQAISRRYLLLPYFFTKLLQASLEGGPVLQHLSLQFPADRHAYSDRFQFMVGGSIMVSPVVVEGATSVSTYFPAGPWYSLWSGTYYTSPNGFIMSPDTPLYAEMPVYVRGGSVVPIHGQALMTVRATRASGVGLICALDTLGNALGDMWTDDGADGPLLNESSVEKRAIECQSTATGGSVVSSIIVGGGLSSVHSRLPLTSPVFVVVYTPAYISAENITFTVDGVPLQLQYYLHNNTLNITMPIGVDVLTTFDLEWTFVGIVPPGGNGSGDSRTIVALLSVSCALLALSLAGLAYYRHSATVAQRDYLLEETNKP